MAALVFGNLIGLLSKILIAQTFGTEMEADAFYAANRVPELLFNLVAGGALASAFIPTLTGLLAKNQRPEAWRLTSGVANLLVLAVSTGAALTAIFAPQVVRYLLASGFSDNPAQEALTIDLVRIMLPSAVIFAVSGLVMGVLNAHQKFFIPALAPGMYPLGLITGILVFSKPLGIFSLAWGVLIGACLHLAIQIPALIRLRGTYTPTLGLNLPAVREVARLMGPRLIGVAVVQLNFWINIQLASFLPEGSITGINYGFALMLMPQAAIAQAIAIASLPTFSAQAALGRLDEMRLSLAATLRGVLLLSLPASLGLILLGRPIVSLLLERGVFDTRSTELVAWALMWYAVGLVGHSVVEVVSRAFYALHNTRTPVVVGVIAMTLNVLLSLLLIVLFGQLGWAPHGGLALANSLATGLEMVLLLTLMRRQLKGLQGRSLLVGLGQAGLAGAAMAAGLVLWNRSSEAAPTWVIVFGGVAAGAVVYALGLRLLRVPEVSALTSAVRRRLSR